MYRGALKLAMDKKGLQLFLTRVVKDYGYASTILLSDRMMSVGTAFGSSGISSILLRDFQRPNYISCSHQEKLRKLLIKQKFNTEYLTRDILIQRARRRIKKIIRFEFSLYIKYAAPLVHTFALATRTSARGGFSQYNQICRARGFMLSETGRVFQKVKGCFFDGILRSDLLISVHGCRKGLIDTALNTATSGYLTRKLVEVLQQLFIGTEDCGTRDGIAINRLIDRLPFKRDQLNAPYLPKIKIIGKYLSQTVTVDESREVWARNTILTTYHYNKICQDKLLQKKLLIRSVNTCQDDWGVCVKCYELKEFDGTRCIVGTTIGVQAAQAMGEPCTQLVLRTFHSGGVASAGRGDTSTLSNGESRHTSYWGPWSKSPIFYESLNSQKNLSKSIINISNYTTTRNVLTHKTTINNKCFTSKNISLNAPISGKIQYNFTDTITLVSDERIGGFFIKKDVYISIITGKTNCLLIVPKGFVIIVTNGQHVSVDQLLAIPIYNFLYENKHNIVKHKFNKPLYFPKKKLTLLEVTEYFPISGEIIIEPSVIFKKIHEIGLDNNNNNKQNKKRIKQQMQCINSGRFWILSGKRYLIERTANSSFEIPEGQKFLSTTPILTQKFFNTYSGFVKFERDSTGLNNLKIIHLSFTLQNLIFNVHEKQRKKNILKIFQSDKDINYEIIINENEKLTNKKVIAIGTTDDYLKTTVGGTIYDSALLTKKKIYKNSFLRDKDQLYWIPEDIQKCSLNKLKVNEGSYVKKGTEILPGIFAKISGIVQITETTSQVSIKPGYLYPMKIKGLTKNVGCFVSAGEIIECVSTTASIIISSLSYIEYISLKGITHLLVRPVTKIEKLQKTVVIETSQLYKYPNKSIFEIKQIRQPLYHHGKYLNPDNIGIKLYQLNLVFYLNPSYQSLNIHFNYVPILKNSYSKNLFNLNLVFYESIPLKLFKHSRGWSFKYLIKNNQYIQPNTTIVEAYLLSSYGDGAITNIRRYGNQIDIRTIDRTTDLVKQRYNISETLNIKKGDFIYVGTFITNKTRSRYNGQVYFINNQTIFIRIGKSFLLEYGEYVYSNFSNNWVTEGDIFKVKAKNKLLDQKDTSIASTTEATYEEDIIRGLPRIIALLENGQGDGIPLSPIDGTIHGPYEKEERGGSKTIIELRDHGKRYKLQIPLSGGSGSGGISDDVSDVTFISGQNVRFLDPLVKLSGGLMVRPVDVLRATYIHFTLNCKPKACKKALLWTRETLTDAIMVAYTKQGVSFDERHAEVLSRQLTRKVCVCKSGDTMLAPGTLLELGKGEAIEEAVKLSGGILPLIQPVLSGLTRIGLSSNSFLAAASFQETASVLLNSAIEGRVDWLLNIKENVLLARLLPLGAGFDPIIFKEKLRNSKEQDYRTFDKIFISPKFNSTRIIKENKWKNLRKLKTRILHKRLNMKNDDIT